MKTTTPAWSLMWNVNDEWSVVNNYDGVVVLGSRGTKEHALAWLEKLNAALTEVAELEARDVHG